MISKFNKKTRTIQCTGLFQISYLIYFISRVNAGIPVISIPVIRR